MANKKLGEQIYERGDYLRLRNQYRPKKIRAIFVLESPPASGKYFYNPAGQPSEPLFAAMMKYLIKMRPATKIEGLRAFVRRGYFLVDATYRPINHERQWRARNQIILRDYQMLVRDLHRIIGKRRTPLILVKANVCRLLEQRLLNDGFRVLNQGIIIPFPSHGHQREFGRRIARIIRRI